MEAPQKGLTREQFAEAVDAHSLREYKLDGNYLICRTCEEMIKWAPCRVFVHPSKDGMRCSGSNIPEWENLPYCPRCEKKPVNLVTCIHITMGEVSFDPPQLEAELVLTHAA